MKLNYILKVEQETRETLLFNIELVETRETLLFNIELVEITAYNNRITLLYLNAMNENDSLTIDFNSSGSVLPTTHILYWLADSQNSYQEVGNTKLSKICGFTI